MQPLHRGSSGSAVAETRQILARLGLLANQDPARADVFDDPTDTAVRHFQQTRGISVDGLVGPETYAALVAARWTLGDRVLQYNPGAPLVGEDVSTLQAQLLELGYNLGRADHVFGRATEEALRVFQRESGLRVDGICGPGTLHALKSLSRRVVGGHPQQLRDMVAVASAGPHLPGKRIVIDPGHGGDDFGTAHNGLIEKNLTIDIARRLRTRAACGDGAEPWRGEGIC